MACEQCTRVIMHADLDAFYAQVEQMRNGIPADQPLVVNQWGMMIAVNYPARAYGIRRGERVDDVIKKCPSCHIIHVDTIGEGHEEQSACKASLEPYRKASFEIMNIFARYCPLTERAGMDEAFLDLTALVAEDLRCGNLSLPELPAELLQTVDGSALQPSVHIYDRLLVCAARRCHEIRKAVFDELGYTVSAGIGPNKMLAKLASAKHKPNKQTLIPFHSIELMMQQMPLRDVRGLRRKLGEQVFRATGAQYAADLQKYSEQQLMTRFGEQIGRWLYGICRGRDDEEVKMNLRPKSLLAFKSFSPIMSLQEIEPWLRLLCEEIAQRIRSDHLLLHRLPKTLVIFHRCQVKNASFEASRSVSVSRSTAMPGAVRHVLPTTEEIFEAAMGQLRRIDPVVPCTRIAVGASDLQQLPSKNSSISTFFSKTQSNSAQPESQDQYRSEDDHDDNNDKDGEESMNELTCAQCGECLCSHEEFTVHMDWHAAQQLHRELNATSIPIRDESKRPHQSTQQSRKKPKPGIEAYFHAIK